jgi:hypothetical protein
MLSHSRLAGLIGGLAVPCWLVDQCRVVPELEHHADPLNFIPQRDSPARLRERQTEPPKVIFGKIINWSGPTEGFDNPLARRKVITECAFGDFVGVKQLCFACQEQIAQDADRKTVCLYGGNAPGI